MPLVQHLPSSSHPTLQLKIVIHPAAANTAITIRHNPSRSRYSKETPVIKPRKAAKNAPPFISWLLLLLLPHTPLRFLYLYRKRTIPDRHMAHLKSLWGPIASLYSDVHRRGRICIAASVHGGRTPYTRIDYRSRLILSLREWTRSITAARALGIDYATLGECYTRREIRKVGFIGGK